jgi:hypothetical protein|tara:strand:+ start:1316 stop:1525 length:210 start_codon:yes stop_codon:yes gene_type:complete
MTSIIKVHNRQIVVPNSLNNAEIFIGKWKKAQNKAIEETIKLTNNSVEEYNFDKLIDEKTVEYYVKDNQ